MKYLLDTLDLMDDIEDDITEELADTSDLPTSVIITNVDGRIFLDESQKLQLARLVLALRSLALPSYTVLMSPNKDETGPRLVVMLENSANFRQYYCTAADFLEESYEDAIFGVFEQIFQQFDNGASFQYFKSFRRVRVNFTTPSAAATARIQCHQTKIADSIINCYFAQPITAVGSKEGESSDPYLQPPSPVRQFLISPPASPPVGWEPVGESQPCINYDLLAALAKLTPGEAHELHPPSPTQPGIIVHVCEDQNTDGPRIKITQTRRPDSMDSSSSSSPPSSPTS